MKKMLCIFLVLGSFASCVEKPEQPEQPEEPKLPEQPSKTTVLDNIAPLQLTDMYPELLTHQRIQTANSGRYMIQLEELTWEHVFDYDPSLLWIPAWQDSREFSFSKQNEQANDGFLRLESIGNGQICFSNVHLPNGTLSFDTATAKGAGKVHLSFNDDFPIDQFELSVFEVNSDFGLAYGISSPGLSLREDSGGNHVFGQLVLTRQGVDIDVDFFGFTSIVDSDSGLSFEKQGEDYAFVCNVNHVFLALIDEKNLPAGMTIDDLPPLTLSASFDIGKIEFSTMSVEMDVSSFPSSITRTGEIRNWPDFLTEEGADICFYEPSVHVYFSPSFQFYMEWGVELFTDSGKTEAYPLVNGYLTQDYERTIIDTDPSIKYGFDKLFRTPLSNTFGFTCTPTVAEKIFWLEGQKLNMTFSTILTLPLLLKGHFSEKPVVITPLVLSGKTLGASAGRDHRINIDLYNTLPFCCELIPEVSYNGDTPIRIDDSIIKIDSYNNKMLEIPLHPDTEDWIAEISIIVYPLEIQNPLSVGQSLQFQNITFTSNSRSMYPQ
jgi:hypothetical protein